MIVYRLCKEKYKDDLSGKGAELSGGRWNSKGVAILYTSQSRALCTAEIAVHTHLGIVPSNYWLVTIEFPDTFNILEINPGKLPKGWNTFPYLHTTQTIGDNFVSEGKHLVMKAPSSVVPGDFNYLINPAHKGFPQVKIIKTEIFEFDERLFIR
jgi:RES domain-containing protein